MAYERSLKDVDNFVFDLDGTVWEWNRLKTGVKDTITSLHNDGKDIYYLTNGAKLQRGQYAKKLRDLGLPADDEDVISASYIAAQTFDSEDIRKAYVIGEEGLRNELQRNKIAHSEDAHHVLVSVDRNFSYWKLAKAADLVRDGAQFWTTSRDGVWWAGDRTLPGTDALVSSISRAADGHEPDVLGKPSEHARRVVKDEWELRPGNTVIVGDDLTTDIAFGNRLGWMTAVVLGGGTEEDDITAAEDDAVPDIAFRAFQRILMKV